jgi:hypothetical protein
MLPMSSGVNARISAFRGLPPSKAPCTTLLPRVSRCPSRYSLFRVLTDRLLSCENWSTLPNLGHTSECFKAGNKVEPRKGDRLLYRAC